MKYKTSIIGVIGIMWLTMFILNGCEPQSKEDLYRDAMIADYENDR